MMYNLKRKIQEQKLKKPDKEVVENATGRPSVRDHHLTKEIPEACQHLPEGCSLRVPQADVFHELVLTVAPRTGYWNGGTYEFDITVPAEYNMLPPTVQCRTKLWHPNIDMQGNVCLSILRSTSIDSSGWAPTRCIKDVVWGLHALFGDLLNFEDPLNVEAANQYEHNQAEFERKVKDYVRWFAK